MIFWVAFGTIIFVVATLLYIYRIQILTWVLRKILPSFGGFGGN